MSQFGRLLSYECVCAGAENVVLGDGPGRIIPIMK